MDPSCLFVRGYKTLCSPGKNDAEFGGSVDVDHILYVPAFVFDVGLDDRKPVEPKVLASMPQGCTARVSERNDPERICLSCTLDGETISTGNWVDSDTAPGVRCDGVWDGRDFLELNDPNETLVSEEQTIEKPNPASDCVR